MNETAPVELSAALCTTESFGLNEEISTPIPPPYEYVLAHSNAALYIESISSRSIFATKQFAKVLIRYKSPAPANTLPPETNLPSYNSL